MKELKNIASPYSKKISAKAQFREKIIKYFFVINGFAALMIMLLIFLFLLKEGYHAFEQISLTDFIYKEKLIGGSQTKIYEWYPTSDEPRFSIIPLLVGTLLTAVPATIISTIFGIAVGIYLSEIASIKLREFLKPIIELFAGIPTVVIGFFMLAVGATIFSDLFNPDNRLNSFLAAFGLSFIIIPVIASLTEDAIRSVPNDLRMGSYALGATRWQTIRKVIVPTAVSGLTAGIILGFGRALGETMIVLMASGNAAELTFDLFRSVRTMTATIAAELGEVSSGSNHYFALFFVGVVLFSFTFILNLIAEIILNRKRKNNQF